jgi:formylmethanofuran dehydrogenase subunit E
MTDAVSAVTGVRLGRRSLKFVDYGKVAATFLNTETGEAVRIVARDDSRKLADERFGEISGKKERQLKAYSEASDSELFTVQRVKVSYLPTDAPGRPLKRIACQLCGEGINDGRELVAETGSVMCRSCGAGGYYELI